MHTNHDGAIQNSECAHVHAHTCIESFPSAQTSVQMVIIRRRLSNCIRPVKIRKNDETTIDYIRLLQTSSD